MLAKILKQLEFNMRNFTQVKRHALMVSPAVQESEAPWLCNNILLLGKAISCSAGDVM
jgi:hypothetical protein